MSSAPFAFNFPPKLFSEQLIQWQRLHGRHDLPWQQTDPYLIWISEIMLQQTQVATVLNYYPRFISAFPTVTHLAQASIDDVTALWAGLGYYSRARNLHHAAQQIMNELNGVFPQQREEIQKLKGIGRSTAAAICAFAFQQRETILDGNVKRVLCRLLALYGNPQDKAFDQRLWLIAEALLPEHAEDMPSYTQGLMDLGATVCTRSKPKCGACPMQNICLAHAQNLTAELPVRKAKTQVQLMPVHWLFIINSESNILLEKRPETGIWSQLYCPPMVDSEQWETFLQTHGINAEQLQTYTPITHKLTHRAMTITPCVWRSNKTIKTTNPSQFYPLQDALNLGLPKPVSVFLNQLNTHTLFD